MLTSIGMLVLIFVILLFMTINETPKENEIKMPESVNYYKNRQYEQVINDLVKLGYKKDNIQTESIDDLIIGWLNNDGDVKEIIIDGKDSFEAGNKFDKDSKIIIIYHTFEIEGKENEPQKPIKVKCKAQYFDSPVTIREEYTFYLDSNYVAKEYTYHARKTSRDFWRGEYDGVPGEGTVVAFFEDGGQQKKVTFTFMDDMSVSVEYEDWYMQENHTFKWEYTYGKDKK